MERKRMRILTAEDDPTSRMLLETMLKKWGYEVVSTCDGNEAWAAMQAEDPPQLAVLDWMMPGLDGVEVCRRIRELDEASRVHVILLTALGDKKDIVTGLEAGASDYLTKPFDQDELRARIDVGRQIVELQSALAKKIDELQEALDHVRTLQGILPICMHCHRIRDDGQSWQRLEEYIGQHSDAAFSHGICPECLEEHYPET